MPYIKLSKQELDTALNVARTAIHEFLYTGASALPKPENYSDALKQKAGCFVTLTVSGTLQGCLGVIFANRPLIEEVHNKAIASAHRDHRFYPLKIEQLSQLNIEVSVLSPPTEHPVTSEQELLNYLEKHKVGVILSDGYLQALFLPQVWQQLPTPDAFIRHLKLKAGWDENYWSDTISVQIFTVESTEGAFLPQA